ncbi:LOW QUALITY PROTEIN: hypothetical protein PHMEG_00021574 [Phytophthora megakarya]|uniref:Uncharacterized protein n=1 Tax=Phytophthora megakarya TaxID=4795 RepID=A0A225VNU0_9STRA|nr:LOW QUALITY PROTEIN: hypothetical protein PHMEG_00021574 [Phytophthora megakarya]
MFWTQYQGPQATTLQDGESIVAQALSGTGPLDELLSFASSSDADDDIQDVRDLSRMLVKRSRAVLHDSVGRKPSLRDVVEADTDDDEGRGEFRSSRAQRWVSNTGMHPLFQGKSSRYILERMQQSEHASFPRLPPVYHGVWEFDFLSRGLTLMHCRPVDLWNQVHAQDTDIFRNETHLSSISRYLSADVSSALRSLKIFAQAFYADELSALIECAVAFVIPYKAISDSDTIAYGLMENEKFGNFWGFVVARDLVSVQGVQYKFYRVDEELMELMDLRRSLRGSDSNQYRGQKNATPRRGDSHRRQSPIPASVLAALQRQGDKKLCMKWISVGCSGNSSGGFDNKRAHFRPKELPHIVRTYIKERFNRLAPEPKEE